MPDFLQFLGAIFSLFPDVLTDEYLGLGLSGQDDAIAGTRVDLDELVVDLVLGAQDDPGKVSVAAKGVDDNPLHTDFKRVEDIPDELVRKRTLVVLTAHGHGYGPSNAGLDVDDEALFLVPDEDGQSLLVGRKNAKDLNAHDIRVHKKQVPPEGLNDNAVTAALGNLIKAATRSGTMKKARAGGGNHRADGDGAIVEIAIVGVEGIALIVIDDKGALRGRLGNMVEGGINAKIQREKNEDEAAEDRKRAFG